MRLGFVHPFVIGIRGVTGLQRWSNARPASQTLAQHWANAGSEFIRGGGDWIFPEVGRHIHKPGSDVMNSSFLGVPGRINYAPHRSGIQSLQNNNMISRWRSMGKSSALCEDGAHKHNYFETL